jgi:hypothetical protein
VRLATGAAERALADFVAAGEGGRVRLHPQSAHPWRSQAALALRQLGRSDEAERSRPRS